MFAKTPETPRELWDAVDYLVRTGQARAAAPFLQQFLLSAPSDDVLLSIRDDDGIGAILRLADHPETRAYAPAARELFLAAARRQATDPERMHRFIMGLTGTGAERAYAVEQLRLAGAAAVPPLITRLTEPGLSRENRVDTITGLRQLDRSIVPSLVGVLQTNDTSLLADVLGVFEEIGDPRAYPFIVPVAAGAESEFVRNRARHVIEGLTGQSWPAQSRSPIRVLLDESRAYLEGRRDLPDPVLIWPWDPANENVHPVQLSKREAETYLGRQFARETLELEPGNREAQTLLVALDVRDASDRMGLDRLLALTPDPEGSATDPAISRALEAGPDVLVDVLNDALRTRQDDLAALAAWLLGPVESRISLMPTTAGPHPLIRALDSPDRRVRLAAAGSLVRLSPQVPLAGASRLVPALAQLTDAGQAPRVVVADSIPIQGSAVGGVMRELGYEPMMAADGPNAFRLAATTAGVAAVFIEAGGLQGAWTLNDLLSSLAADSRTADLPVFVYGPLAKRSQLFAAFENNSRARFVVTPTDAATFQPIWERELAGLGIKPDQAEQVGQMAQRAAALLATLASQSGQPFAADLPVATESLIRAVSADPSIAAPAAVALGSIPSAQAQRRLADLSIDPMSTDAVRATATVSLARSIQRFGPLISDEQERALLTALSQETNPGRRDRLASVIGALKPRSELVGTRLEASEAAAIPESTDPAPVATPPVSNAAGPAAAAPAAPPLP